MIIGCKEHCECICPDFPDKCTLCGWYIDNRKEKIMQFYVQYKDEKGSWKFVKSAITGQRVKFWNKEDAKDCMRICFNSGYTAQVVIFEKKMKWVERMER